MPRYFFQVIDGEVIADLEGFELPGLTAARHAAADIAANHLKGSGEELWRERGWRLEVSDEAGLSVLVLTVSAQTLAPAQVMPEPNEAHSTSTEKK